MSLYDRAALAEHGGFRRRVRMAAVDAAVDVAAEADPAANATDAEKRRAGLRANLATNVLNDPAGYEERFAWTVATNATIGTGGLAAPDGDIEFVVSSIWDAIAGV